MRNDSCTRPVSVPGEHDVTRGGASMNTTLKKFLIGSAVALLAIALLGGIAGAVLYSMASSRPSSRFLMSNSGFRVPSDYVRTEEFIRVGGTQVSVMVYRHPSGKSKKYFMLQHGLTPEGHKHPVIDRFAASLCDATGMNILIPYVEGSITGGSLVDAYDRMARIYISLVKHYPGEYRAFGACIGANILLMALNRVPDAIYPQKIFMLGPFFDGSQLLDFYNQASNPEEIDIMVKMAVTLNMNVFTEPEKELIRMAIAASKPGVTDRGEMKKIMGEKLFNDIAVVKLRHGDFEAINPRTMFGRRKTECQYFIIHSKTDNIIPYFEGKNLAAFMQKSGISTKFLGTEYVDHAENRADVTGFIREMQYLIRFFDELFAGDVEK